MQAQILGTMHVGTVGYASATALVVDPHGACRLRADAERTPRPDWQHALFVVRTERGFLVDITALDGVPEHVAAAEAGRCAPVIEVVFGDEAIFAA